MASTKNKQIASPVRTLSKCFNWTLHLLARRRDRESLPPRMHRNWAPHQIGGMRSQTKLQSKESCLSWGTGKCNVPQYVSLSELHGLPLKSRTHNGSLPLQATALNNYWGYWSEYNEKTIGRNRATGQARATPFGQKNLSQGWKGWLEEQLS